MKRLIFILMLGGGLTSFSQDSTRTLGYNYRMGMIHYNRGVDLINNVSLGEPQLILDSLSAESKSEFNKAIPFLYRAYSMKPKDENVLRALQGSYFGLSEFEKSERYKKELEALKK